MGMFDSLRSGIQGMRNMGNSASGTMSNTMRGLGPSQPIQQMVQKVQASAPYNLKLAGSKISDAMRYQAPQEMRNMASMAGRGIQGMASGMRGGIQQMASNARRNMPSMNRFW